LNHTRFSSQHSLENLVQAAALKLRAQRKPLQTLSRFYDLADDILHPPAIEKAKAEGRKIIGFYCAMVPQELIVAFGALPVRLCAGLPMSGCDPLSRDCCPIVSSSCELIGPQADSLYSQLDAVIVPSVCDWKTRFAEVIATRFPTFAMQVPLNKREPSAHDERLRNLSLLIDFLGQVTGRRFSRRKLLESIALFQKAGHATRRLADLMLDHPPAIRGSDFLLVMNLSFFDDVVSWTSAVKQLAAEARDANNETKDVSERGPRLLLTGAPIIWPNWKVLEMVEEAGGNIVAEELCSGSRVFYDPVRVDEPTTSDMLSALAERYSLACTCPCFVPNDDRVYRNTSLASRYDVDGVIYHNLRTCYLYHMEAAIFRKEFQKLRVPFLEIETDYSPEDRGQLSIRIETFIEMLRSRKPNSASPD
jgi:benzoyl-CoA reductase/2-hydroxyglutaryl-CoA dehydratase subunit BcrC/BadD/HgdB